VNRKTQANYVIPLIIFEGGHTKYIVLKSSFELFLVGRHFLNILISPKSNYLTVNTSNIIWNIAKRPEI